jgi:hypothetical protein
MRQDMFVGGAVVSLATAAALLINVVHVHGFSHCPTSRSAACGQPQQPATVLFQPNRQYQTPQTAFLLHMATSPNNNDVEEGGCNEKDELDQDLLDPPRKSMEQSTSREDLGPMSKHIDTSRIVKKSTSRRHVLQQAATLGTGGVLLGGANIVQAYPGYGGGGEDGPREFRGDVEEQNGIIDSTRRNKVALRTSTSNVPNKYEPSQKSKTQSSINALETSAKDEDTSSENSITNGENSPTSSTTCQCNNNNIDAFTPTGPFETTEQRRISTFERVAPSVVFIDTFSVARDSFSTNM